jgi:VWFA-related protein
MEEQKERDPIGFCHPPALLDSPFRHAFPSSPKIRAGRHRSIVRSVILECLAAIVAFTITAESAQRNRTIHHAGKGAASRTWASTTPTPPVQVSVVVRNREGRAIGNLPKSAFHLYDDNRIERVADFGANVVPALEADPRVPSTIRYTALYFDDLHYTFTDTIRVTDSAYATFGPRLSDRRQFGVFTASGEITLNFTGNREKFHQALLAIRPHLLSPAMAKACPALTDYQAYLLLYVHDPLALKVALYDLERCPSQDGARDPLPPRLSLVEMKRLKAVVDAQAGKVIADDEIRSTETLAGLDRLITEVATLPDPRTIIVASPGFLTGTLGRRVDELARRATKLHIIVNTLDTIGFVRHISFTPPPGRSRPLEEEAIIDAKNEMLADRAGAASDPLADLATMTGGNFIANVDDLDLGFKMAAPLSEAYYVLGYHPANLRPNGRFHSVRVTLWRHGDLSVQAPAGYFAPGAPAAIAASSLRDRHLRHRRRRRK